MTESEGASAAPASGHIGDATAAAGPLAAPAVLWAEALQAVATLVGHDLRNALNAVAVNLEVVRSRSARGAEAAGITPFATTAASQFEAAAAAAEALLSLVRPEPATVDLMSVLRRLAAVVAVGGHRTVTLDDRSGGRAMTDAPADIVRAAVARSVLGALSAGDAVACEITADDGIFVRVTGTPRVPPPPDPGLVKLALAWGIQFALRGHSLELRFPPSTNAPPRTHS